MGGEFKGGIPDIGSMSMGAQANGVGTGGRGTKLRLNKSLPIVIAAVGLAVLAAVIGGRAADKGKVKDVVVQWMTEELYDIDLEKYYPDELVTVMEAEIEEYGRDSYNAFTDTLDIIGISKLSVKKYENQIMTAVTDMCELWDADLGKRDIDISGCYLVSYICEYNGEEALGSCFVVKVNGRYGAYEITAD